MKAALASLVLALSAPVVADAPTKPASPSKQLSLVVVVAADGSVAVADKPISDPDLDVLFHAAFQRDKNTQVSFDTDDKVPHARVVELLDRAKTAGLVRLAIKTHKS